MSTNYKVHLQMQDAEGAIPMITIAADVSSDPIRIEVHSQGWDPGPEGAVAVAQALRETADTIMEELGDDNPLTPATVLNPAGPLSGGPDIGPGTINPGISGFATPQHVRDARAARAEARRPRFNPQPQGGKR